MPPGLQAYVTAFFDAPAVSLKKSGTGTGTVTSSPAGIDCGPSCSAQDGFFAADGEQVTLTATPAPGSSFAGWTGCDSTVANSCIATARLDPSHDVTAQFTTAAALTMLRIAGTGTPCLSAAACDDGGAATSAQLSFPSGVAVDAAGNIYISDTSDQEIREVSTHGTISRIAGTGVTCSGATCGDGGPAVNAQLDNPQSVAIDTAGDLYIADTDDQEVRKISPGGTITTVAGIHGEPCSHPPACGDGGPATSAQLSQPLGVAIDAQGNVYIADGGDNEIRKVAPDGMITRIAGSGTPCTTAPSCGDGGAATSAAPSTPSSIAVGSSGELYIADTADNEVRKVAASGTITRIAGTGHPCEAEPACTDGPMATQAALSIPMGVATADGEVLIADTGDNLVWAVDPFGQISQVAGTGIRCTTAPNCGDGGPAASAQLNDPEGITVDSLGNLDIADTQDQEIRQAQVRRPL
jgi:hypothetical protein